MRTVCAIGSEASAIVFNCRSRQFISWLAIISYQVSWKYPSECTFSLSFYVIFLLILSWPHHVTLAHSDLHVYADWLHYLASYPISESNYVTDALCHLRESIMSHQISSLGESCRYRGIFWKQPGSCVGFLGLGSDDRFTWEIIISTWWWVWWSPF